MPTTRRRILYLACEPWETQVAIMALNSIKKEHGSIDLHLAIADTYTVNYAGSLLDELNAKTQLFSVSTLSEEFSIWQTPDAPNPDYAYLRSWVERIEPSRSALELQRTHQGLHGYENERYYLPLSPEWKDRIFIDTIKWIQGIVDHFQPTLVFSVERRSLAANLASEITSKLGIPMLTLVQSRVGNLWSFRDDFGYGTSNETMKRITESLDDPRAHASSLILIENLKENGSLYSSRTRQRYTDLEDWLRKPNTSALREYRRSAKRGVVRLLIERKVRRVATKRADQSLLKLTLWEVARATRLWTWALFGYPNMIVTLPEGPYFLWCLHARPEDSVAVLGNGRDELHELLRAAAALPTNSTLVVKENAQMMGLRKPEFYRALRGDARIKIASPLADTRLFIDGSEGVIGISGTVLLEAALLDKPSCVLGSPEFIGEWKYQGWDSASSFFRDVQAGVAASSRNEAMAYLAFVLTQVPTIDLVSETPIAECEEFITAIADVLIAHAVVGDAFGPDSP